MTTMTMKLRTTKIMTTRTTQIMTTLIFLNYYLRIFKCWDIPNFHIFFFHKSFLIFVLKVIFCSSCCYSHTLRGLLSLAPHNCLILVPLFATALCEKPLKKWHLELSSPSGDYSTFLCLSLSFLIVNPLILQNTFWSYKIWVH